MGSSVYSKTPEPERISLSSVAMTTVASPENSDEGEMHFNEPLVIANASTQSSLMMQYSRLLEESRCEPERVSRVPPDMEPINGETGLLTDDRSFIVGRLVNVMTSLDDTTPAAF
jgi:hypothetical protein